MLAVSLAISVAAAETVIRFTMPEWREFSSGRFMEQVQPPGHAPITLGRAGFDGYFAQNNGDFRARIRINRVGLRNPEPVNAADGRIWAVGDSITFGWGVAEDERYSSVIAAALGRATYNVASPGTDVCGYQTLVDRMPDSVRPTAVIVGLVLENDLAPYRCRRRAERATAGEGDKGGSVVSLTGIKQYFTRQSALYNFVAVSLKRVNVLDEALKRIGLVAKEHAYRANFDARTVDERVARTADELARLGAQLPEAVPFAVLIVPARFEIRDGDALFAAARRKITAALAARGVAVIDPFAEFRAAGFAATHFAHDGHWSPLGHAIAGRKAAAWLRKALGPPIREPKKHALFSVKAGAEPDLIGHLK